MKVDFQKLYKRVEESVGRKAVKAKYVEELAELAVECLYNISKVTHGIDTDRYDKLIQDKVLTPWDERVERFRDNQNNEIEDYNDLKIELADVITTAGQYYRNANMMQDVDRYHRFVVYPKLESRYIKGTLCDGLDTSVVVE